MLPDLVNVFLPLFGSAPIWQERLYLQISHCSLFHEKEIQHQKSKLFALKQIVTVVVIFVFFTDHQLLRACSSSETFLHQFLQNLDPRFCPFKINLKKAELNFSPKGFVCVFDGETFNKKSKQLLLRQFPNKKKGEKATYLRLRLLFTVAFQTHESHTFCMKLLLVSHDVSQIN